MQDYYRNLTIEDVKEVLDLDNIFSNWDSYYQTKSKDLYFVGIKRGKNQPVAFVPFETH